MTQKILNAALYPPSHPCTPQPPNVITMAAEKSTGGFTGFLKWVDGKFDEMLEVKLKAEGLEKKDFDDFEKKIADGLSSMWKKLDEGLESMLDVKLKAEGLTREDLDNFPSEVNALLDEMLEVKLK